MRDEDRIFLGRAIVLTAALSFSFIGYGLIQPLVSLYTAGFVGASYLMVGTLISSIGLVKAGMDPLSGFLSDTYGNRKLATLGALAIALGLAVAALSGSAAQLIAAYVIYGLGQALFFLAMMTSMVEAAGPSRRALALGIYEGGNGASILVGTALSGPVTVSFGPRLTFGLAAGLTSVSLLICALLMRETSNRRDISFGALSLRDIGSLMSREYATGMFCAFLFMYTHSLFMAIIPLYATTTVQIQAELLPILFMGFSGSTAVGSLCAGPISDSVGRRPPIALGMIVSAASFASIPLLTNVTEFALASLALGFGSGFFHPVASAIVADVSPAETRGKAFGFYRLIRDAGSFAGPAVAGVVSSLLGVNSLFYFSVGLSSIGAALALFAIKETLRKP